MRPSLSKWLLVGLLGISAAGCASSPVAPFNTMEKATVTAFRLQNYEEPAASQATATSSGQTQLIPGLNLPAQANQLLQQGAQALQQLLPPGSLPQLPGAAAPVQTVPRFQGFRILAQTQIMDSELRVKLGELFGNADNYETPKSTCFYPDFGFAFGQPGAATYDFVVSTQCHQVQAKSFPWPSNMQSGMTVDMEQELAELARQIWPS